MVRGRFSETPNQTNGDWLVLEPPVWKICAGQTGSFPPFVWVKCMKKLWPKKCVKTKLKPETCWQQVCFWAVFKGATKIVVGRHAFLVPFSEGISSKRVGWKEKESQSTSTCVRMCKTWRCVAIKEVYMNKLSIAFLLNSTIYIANLWGEIHHVEVSPIWMYIIFTLNLSHLQPKIKLPKVKAW